MICGNFLVYSTMAVLSYCSCGVSLNDTWWIDSYLELYMMSGSFSFICRLCSFAAASAVLGMSEKLARIMSLISLSVAVADSSANTCNMDGAMPWQISSLNDELLNFEAVSIWLSPVIHLALFVPSKVLMFFIICLVPSPLLFVTACVRICMNASVMLGACVGDMLFTGGVLAVVLVLGWFRSWWF